MKIFKRILIILLVVLVLIQFFRPEKNISMRTSQAGVTLHYNTPNEVKSILAKACNDCHSNNTKYPGYANIQPVAWWLNDHIKEGKSDLNFSEFNTYRIRKQYRKMEEVIDLVKKDEMPLASYTIIHKDAKLNNEEKLALAKWADEIRDTLQARYPPDSLIGKGK